MKKLVATNGRNSASACSELPPTTRRSVAKTVASVPAVPASMIAA